MLVLKKIVLKEQLFDLFNDEQVESFKVIKQRNKTINNPLVCQVEVNYILTVGEILSILGSVDKHLSKNFFSHNDRGFLTSLQLIKSTFSIKRSIMSRLIEMEKEYNITFSIPKKIKKILKEYK